MSLQGLVPIHIGDNNKVVCIPATDIPRQCLAELVNVQPASYPEVCHMNIQAIHSFKPLLWKHFLTNAEPRMDGQYRGFGWLV